MRTRQIEVGDVLITQRRSPTAVQLFRYSAATDNTHRIHYDRDYAHAEGYPNVLVQSHLHGAWLTSLCTSWLDGRGYLESIAVTVRRFAVPGDALTCRASAVSIDPDGTTGRTRIRLELEEVREADDTLCASGQATVVLVAAAGQRVPVPLPADAGNPHSTEEVPS